MKFLTAATTAIIIAASATTATAAPPTNAATPLKATQPTPTATQAIATPAPLPISPLLDNTTSLTTMKFIDIAEQSILSIPSYSFRLTISEDVPKKKTIDESRVEQLKNIYEITFLKTGPIDKGCCFRIDPRKGIHKNSLIVYQPDKQKGYIYKIYRPAIPKGKYVDVKDIRMSDLRSVTISDYIAYLKTATVQKGAAPKLTYHKDSNSFILEFNDFLIVNSREVQHRVTVLFDARTLTPTREDRFQRKGRSSEYLFRSRFMWNNFVPDKSITLDQITQAPDFK